MTAYRVTLVCLTDPITKYTRDIDAASMGDAIEAVETIVAATKPEPYEPDLVRRIPRVILNPVMGDELNLPRLPIGEEP